MKHCGPRESKRSRGIPQRRCIDDITQYLGIIGQKLPAIDINGKDMQRSMSRSRLKRAEDEEEN